LLLKIVDGKNLALKDHVRYPKKYFAILFSKFCVSVIMIVNIALFLNWDNTLVDKDNTVVAKDNTSVVAKDNISVQVHKDKAGDMERQVSVNKYSLHAVHPMLSWSDLDNVKALLHKT